MTTERVPAKVRLSDQLGHANKARQLVERLRTDVLWHRRRGNDTIAHDCEDAADEIERLRTALCEIANTCPDSLLNLQAMAAEALKA